MDIAEPEMFKNSTVVNKTLLFLIKLNRTVVLGKLMIRISFKKFAPLKFPRFQINNMIVLTSTISSQIYFYWVRPSAELSQNFCTKTRRKATNFQINPNHGIKIIEMVFLVFCYNTYTCCLEFIVLL